MSAGPPGVPGEKVEPMTDQRRVLLLAHPGRAEARDVARQLVDALTGHGIQVRVLRRRGRRPRARATSPAWSSPTAATRAPTASWWS